MKFKVKWDVEVEADTPEAAALEAFRIWETPGVPIFDVVREDGTVETVDAEDFPICSRCVNRCDPNIAHFGEGDVVCEGCFEDENVGGGA